MPVAIRNPPPHPLAMPPAGHFLPPAAESTQRTPPKPMVLESFRAWNASRVENLLPREPGALVCRRAFASSLRLHPLAAHAGPR